MKVAEGAARSSLVAEAPDEAAGTAAGAAAATAGVGAEAAMGGAAAGLAVHNHCGNPCFTLRGPELMQIQSEAVQKPSTATHNGIVKTCRLCRRACSVAQTRC